MPQQTALLQQEHPQQRWAMQQPLRRKLRPARQQMSQKQLATLQDRLQRMLAGL
jgi:hypothetical protein